MYDVVIEATAVSDLRGILRYISETLKEPETARRVYLSIKDKIMTLNHFPTRQPLVNDETYANRGLRMLPAENYVAFCIVDEANEKVHVLRVLYKRREWHSLL